MTTNQKSALGVCLSLYLFFFAVLVSFYSSQYHFEKRNKEEQKLTLFSENAFYYNFFEDLIEAKSLKDAHSVLFDNKRIESPKTIRPIVSFNLAPEVVLATIYVVLHSIWGSLTPLSFYLSAVFAVSALTIPMIYLIAIHVFKTKKYFLVGILTALFSFLALNYLTRSFTYPGLRENFAIPFLLLFVYTIIAQESFSKKHTNYLLIGSVLANLLFWQFSFFTLLPILAVSIFIYRAQPHYKYMAIAILLLMFVRAGAFTHVFEFISDKIKYKPHFDSLIYSCERAFNPPTSYMLETLAKKLVLPLYLFSLLFTAYQYQTGHKKPSSHHVFLIVISIIFLTYSLNSNRFFVLFIPFGIILSLYPFTHLKDEYFLIVFALLGISLIQNSPHLSLNSSYINYSDKTRLISWIKQNTLPDDTITGTMQATSFVRLLTDRKITNHPQYEIASNRKTTKDTYLVYTHTSPEKIHNTLTELQTDYLILDVASCYNSTSMGCFVEDLYQDQGYDLKSSRLFCDTNFNNSKLFKPVYSSPTYRVLKVL